MGEGRNLNLKLKGARCARIKACEIQERVANNGSAALKIARVVYFAWARSQLVCFA